jgi:hypothetical protein
MPKPTSTYQSTVTCPVTGEQVNATVNVYQGGVQGASKPVVGDSIPRVVRSLAWSRFTGIEQGLSSRVRNQGCE